MWVVGVCRWSKSIFIILWMILIMGHSFFVQFHSPFPLFQWMLWNLKGISQDQWRMLFNYDYSFLIFSGYSYFWFQVFWIYICQFLSLQRWGGFFLKSLTALSLFVNGRQEIRVLHYKRTGLWRHKERGGTYYYRKKGHQRVRPFFYFALLFSCFSEI